MKPDSTLDCGCVVIGQARSYNDCREGHSERNQGPQKPALPVVEKEQPEPQRRFRMGPEGGKAI